MTTATRRQILAGLLGTTGMSIVGCSEDASSDDGPLPSTCPGDLGRATLLGLVPFVTEGTSPLEAPIGAGLDGRLYTDLSRLPEDATTVPNEHFYVRTKYPDRLNPAAPWNLRIAGLVETPVDLSLDTLAARARPVGVHLLECSGNTDLAQFGMLSTAEWSGVPLGELLQSSARALPAATRVRVSGFDEHSQPSERSTPGASWIFTFAELAKTNAFLATTMNGAPLPPDHGAPLRLVVPGWYGCTCIKWVNAVDLVGEDEPATAHMIEFASRTMQAGEPSLARDYVSAAIDQAAMPVRVERWAIDGKVLHRIVGVMWGGERPTDALTIQIGDDAPEPVLLCTPQSANTTWTWWSHAWRPRRPGTYPITMRIADPTVRTRRLDSGFYVRRVKIDAI